MKKVLSLFLSVVMLLSITAGIDFSAQAAAKRTQSEAVNWANSQVGKALDYDGVYGAQCVDLIYYYYVYLGETSRGGNACDYMNNSLPSGWKRITYTTGMTPQPGDIAVWKKNISSVTGSNGHVSIVISANSSTFVTVQQNSSGRQYCTKDSNRKNSWIQCLIRPAFKSSTVTNPSVSVKAASNVTSASAQVNFTCNNPSKVTIKTVGCQVRIKGASSWTTKSEAMNSSYTNAASVPMWWTVGSGKEINMKLYSGITYEYRAYVVYNGTNYYSSINTFTTAGTHSHTWNSGSVTRYATCTQNGIKTYTCTVCGGTKTESIAATGHTVVTDKAVAATCTQSGKTQGSHCSVCGAVITAQKTIAAKGHDFGNNNKYCSVCSAENPNYKEPQTQPPTVSATDTQSWIIVTEKNSYYEEEIKESSVENDYSEPVQSNTVNDTVNDTSSDTISLPNPKKASISKLTKAKKSFKVTWKKVSSVSGYQIQYSTDKKFKKNKKSVTIKGNKSKSPSKTIKNLKSKKTYYVRIRTYKTVKLNGKNIKVYSSWSKVKSLKTK